jgi:hypothetical protein
VASDAGEPQVEAAALAALGRAAVLVADPSAATICSEAVAAATLTGDPILRADALLAQAGACERVGSWEQAGVLAGEALVLYREGGDPYGAATALGEQGWYDMVHGRLDAAEQCLEEALGLRRRHGDDRRLVEPLINHAWLMLFQQRGEEAAVGFTDCMRLARHVDDQFNLGEVLAGLSTQAALDERWVEAARLAGAADAVHERIGAPPWETVTALQDRELAAARAALGETFRARFDEGRELSAEEAVALSDVLRSNSSADVNAAARRG